MAQTSEINPDMQAEQAFQAVARASLERYRRHLPALRQSWDPEALHQARVGLRQLLATFALFRPMIEDEPFRRLRTRVKSAARLLGKARNLDIVLEAAHQPDLPTLRSTVSVLRSRTYAGVIRRLEGDGDHHLGEEVLDWVENGPWRSLHKELRQQKLANFAARRLDRF
jgi:CHAD domain-containing protein